MATHPDTIEGYDGSLEDLAKSLGNMRYEAFAELLGHLADDVQRQADNDALHGRTKLSAKLNQAAKRLYDAQEHLDSAWKICEKYMKNE